MQKPPKALVAEWRAKLADAGFKDIENSEGKLHQHDAYWFANRRQARRYEATRAYYEQFEDLLVSGLLTDPKDVQALELYCSGLGSRAIGAEMGVSHWTVNQRLKRLKAMCKR